MNYFEIHFFIDPLSPGSEILMAELSETGYESFMEVEEGLLAYIPENIFKESDIKRVAQKLEPQFSISWKAHQVPDQNWNKVWESDYQPVVIKNSIYIYAPFHQVNDSYTYQIEIEPRMSFGTAHHETTSLMMEWMLQEDLTGKTVLDMGCGTGILAILAEMMGAAKVVAIDNDSNAVDNCRDNIKKNKCKKIGVLLGDSSAITGSFDLILANINTNILLADIEIYSKSLARGGVLLLSGFYKSDFQKIADKSKYNGIHTEGLLEKNNWVAARFIKS